MSRSGTTEQVLMRDCDQAAVATVIAALTTSWHAAHAGALRVWANGRPGTGFWLIHEIGWRGKREGPLACNAPIKQTAGRGLRLQLPESLSESENVPSVIPIGAETTGGPAEVCLLSLLRGLASLDSGEWPRLALLELLRRDWIEARRLACSLPPGGARWAGMPACSPCSCKDTVTSRKLHLPD